MPPPPPSEGKSSAVISGGVRAGRPEKGAPGGRQIRLGTLVHVGRCVLVGMRRTGARV